MSWDQIKGQTRVTRILKQAILSSRVGHAYLFMGPKGVGKKNTALYMAKALFCEKQNGESCGECQTCRRIKHGNHSDVHLVSPDGNSIKIGQVRELRKEFAYRAKESLQKVYIVEHVDTMTPEAANSLLKFLEEPATQVVAILLTEKPHAVLSTVLSRCQQIQFNRPAVEQIVEELTGEGIEESKARIASQITANLDSARELCQSKSFAHIQNVVIQLTQGLLKTPNQSWITAHELFKDEEVKHQMSLLLDILLIWMKDILNFQLDRKNKVDFIGQVEHLHSQALQWSHQSLIQGIEEVSKTKIRLQRHANPQLSLERLLYHLQEG